MEVVCLSLGPMLASQPCLHAFWVLTSLHLLSFLLKMCFYYSCFHCFFFRNGVNILCRLQKYWCKLYHMKSYICTFVCKFTYPNSIHVVLHCITLYDTTLHCMSHTVSYSMTLHYTNIILYNILHCMTLHYTV